MSQNSEIRHFNLEELQFLVGRIKYTGFSQIVSNLLINKMILGEVNRFSCTTIAEELGMSRRTLQRHVGIEMNAFTLILESSRFKAALELGRNPNFSVSQINAALGFSEKQGFSRLTRKLTGMTAIIFLRQVRTKQRS